MYLLTLPNIKQKPTYTHKLTHPIYTIWQMRRQQRCSQSDSVCCCSGGHAETLSLVLRSFSTVCRHVSLGHPLFLLPRGVNLRAVLVNELGVMRQTCPYHRHRHVCIISASVPIPVIFLSSSF